MAVIGEMQYLTIGDSTYSIPTSGGSTVSITRNLTSGTKSATITVDETSYDIYSMTVPTNISAFTNDVGYLTSGDIPEGASAYTGTISAVGTSASTGTNNGFARGDHVHNITGTTITSALGYTPYNSTNPNGYVTTDTKNTAGSTDSSSKLYLIGATSQAANPQTYSQDTAYVDTDGCLYSGGQKTIVDSYIYSAGDVSTSIRIIPTTNEYGSNISIGALDSIHSKALSLNIGSSSIAFFDLSREVKYIEVCSINDYPDGCVFIYGLPTPEVDGQAANKKYVDDSIPTTLPASDVYAWAKAATKPTYTYSEVGAAASSHTHGNITNGGDITATAPTIASGDQIIINDNSASKITNGPTFDGSTTTKALTPKGTWETFAKSSDIPTVPTNISAFTNDSGYLTSYTETDPTVPSWAKAASKPTYTASEVGALPSTTIIPSITLNGSSTTSPSFYAPTSAGTDGYVLTSNGSGAPIWATVAAVGMIEMFAGSVAPSHWLLCDGSAVSRTTYSALFAVIGTTYGSGDGSTTFNLPDLVGRVPIGAGTGSAITSTQHTLGSTGGEETHTLTPEETALKGHTHSLSSHTHTLSSHTHTTAIGSHRHYPYSGSSYKFVQTTSGQTVNAGGISGSGTRVYVAAATSATTNWQSQTGSTDIGSKTSGEPSNNTSGGPSNNTSGNVTETNGTAHNIMQPYLSINYIIYAGN